MKSYRDWNISKDAHQPAIEVHTVSLQLPKFELNEEGSQIRWSSKAASVAIVEGDTRKRYKVEVIKFLTYPQAECDETIEHLEYLVGAKSLTDEMLFVTLKDKYVALSKQIIQFIERVENNWNSFPSDERNQ